MRLHTPPHRRTRAGRAVLATVAAASTLGVVACGSDTAGSETGTSVEDIVEDEAAVPGPPYIGPYDETFREDIDSYDGQQVTVSADVDEVLTPAAFSLAGGDVGSLLVLGATEDAAISPGTAVEVSGTVHARFVVTEAEEVLGMELDDALFTEWEQQPYIAADGVEVVDDAG